MKTIFFIAVIAVTLAIGGCGASVDTDRKALSNEDNSSQTVEQRTVVETPEPTAEYGSYGSDPYLDGLYDDCEAGEAQACEDLFMESPVDSEYEAFGNSQPWPEDSEESTESEDFEYSDEELYEMCQNGNESACTYLERYAPADSPYSEPTPMNYGDHPDYDELYDRCEDGEDLACSYLRTYAPAGSEYEEMGRSNLAGF